MQNLITFGNTSKFQLSMLYLYCYEYTISNTRAQTSNGHTKQKVNIYTKQQLKIPDDPYRHWFREIPDTRKFCKTMMFQDTIKANYGSTMHEIIHFCLFINILKKITTNPDINSKSQTVYT